MKKITMFLMIGATVALLALPVAATNLITANDDAVQDPCSADSKNALYQDFLKNRKDDQAKAYDAAKKYLACPTAEVTEEQQKIIDYLKKWTTAYDEGTKAASFDKVLFNDKNYPEAFKIGADRLAKNPDDVYVLVALGTNGYLVAGKNPELAPQALDYARRALQAIEGGKAVESWGPLNNKETALAYLNFTAGTLTLEKDPSNALKNLIKSAQYETPLKKSPFTYAYIAGAYETGPYAKQSEEYKRLYFDKPETPESKLALANINQLVERMVDGYARAVFLAGSDANFAKQKPVWQESLTTWYKYLHDKSDAGMTEYVASIMSKPLPPEPTPLVSLPTPAPAATPAGTSGAANGNGTSSTTAPAGTTQPASKASTTPATTKPGTTPASASKPAGTKPGTNPDRPRN